jgi:hypothetical protein
MNLNILIFQVFFNLDIVILQTIFEPKLQYYITI